MSNVTFFKNPMVSRPVSLNAVSGIKSLKQMELSKENFNDVPKDIIIQNIMSQDSVSFRKAGENDPDYGHLTEERRPYKKAIIKAMSYDKLNEINEALAKNRDFGQMLISTLNTFELLVKNDTAGVGEFSKMIEEVRERAGKKELKKPALVLLGCDIAFLPKWDMNQNQYNSVEIVLKGIDNLKIIEEPSIFNESEEEEETKVSVSDLLVDDTDE
ncbi:MAG: hypothetical protein E6Y55_27770 [Klebsiella michiganensis]|jgi:hypothetical protein|nr:MULTISPECIES: hypothetical protein [Terrabacteria group]MDU4544839.1 hypothetical protein [Klebsiella michiganensis]MDU4571034.1 hypothetical protein [Corynebacterium sp.]HCY9496491.1 hypothetical protein [Staphylococcus aureus]HDZ6075020.1 hypothetical protein [Staphylococcus aureus]